MRYTAPRLGFFLDCGAAIDLVFVEDGSNSISDGEWNDEKGTDIHACVFIAE